MNEKEIKKIDEKGEEKVSGGAKSLRSRLEEASVNPKLSTSILAYGGPLIDPRHFLEIKKKAEEAAKSKKTEEALTPSQPQTEEKK